MLLELPVKSKKMDEPLSGIMATILKNQYEVNPKVYLKAYMCFCVFYLHFNSPQILNQRLCEKLVKLYSV